MSTVEPETVEAEDSGGLTSGGQYLCASCLLSVGAYIAILLSWLYTPTGAPVFEFGMFVIMATIGLASLLFSIIGLLAKPQGVEWAFAVPTLGPIVPLALVGFSVVGFMQ